MRRFWQLILKFINWKTEGEIPPHLNKYIFVVVPHTSNWDFFLGVTIRGAMGFHSNYLGKKSLFRFPYGFIFRALGGIPVDRSKKLNMVDQIVEEVNKREKFGLAIAPEGTRKKVETWKTGFYYIALKSGIPIIPVQFDWEHRTARFLPPFYPRGDISVDLAELKSKFEGIKGYTDLNTGK